MFGGEKVLCYKTMLKETQGWKAESKHLGQERAAGMRTAENLWHTMKLSPQGAAMHPAAADTFGSQSPLCVPCENGVKSPQVNPVLTPPVLLTPLIPREAMAVPSPGQHILLCGQQVPVPWAEGAFGTGGPA